MATIGKLLIGPKVEEVVMANNGGKNSQTDGKRWKVWNRCKAREKRDIEVTNDCDKLRRNNPRFS